VERIVVGIDGSSQAEHALDWAIGEAERVGAEVDAVVVHPSPVQMYAVPMEAVIYTGVTREELDRSARDLLSRTIDRVRGTRAVDVHHVVAEGRPAAVLRDCAKGAHLLVVGTRGYGAIRGSLIGSVALKVLHDPPCPVVLVPMGEESEQE
jgi:nucleotide-binding universal stress UspA family protein